MELPCGGEESQGFRWEDAQAGLSGDVVRPSSRKFKILHRAICDIEERNGSHESAGRAKLCGVLEYEEDPSWTIHAGERGEDGEERFHATELVLCSGNRGDECGRRMGEEFRCCISAGACRVECGSCRTERVATVGRLGVDGREQCNATSGGATGVREGYCCAPRVFRASDGRLQEWYMATRRESEL